MNTQTAIGHKIVVTAAYIAELSGESLTQILDDLAPYNFSDERMLEVLTDDLIAWENREIEWDSISNDWATR